MIKKRTLKDRSSPLPMGEEKRKKCSVSVRVQAIENILSNERDERERERAQAKEMLASYEKLYLREQMLSKELAQNAERELVKGKEKLDIERVHTERERAQLLSQISRLENLLDIERQNAQRERQNAQREHQKEHARERAQLLSQISRLENSIDIERQNAQREHAIERAQCLSQISSLENSLDIERQNAQRERQNAKEAQENSVKLQQELFDTKLALANAHSAHTLVRSELDKFKSNKGPGVKEVTKLFLTSLSIIFGNLGFFWPLLLVMLCGDIVVQHYVVTIVTWISAHVVLIHPRIYPLFQSTQSSLIGTRVIWLWSHPLVYSFFVGTAVVLSIWGSWEFSQFCVEIIILCTSLEYCYYQVTCFFREIEIEEVTHFFREMKIEE